ncbi:MAG: hypothetical protein FD138_1649 [Planctomycetota bacterium]|nr:MAG: hypothetical protein FD138_1649 [Planctomycetota bacterium]
MKEYTVIYEWAGENYSAYVPDLPGCVACGDTVEETEELMKEAIELYIEALRDDGQPIPEPTTKARALSVVA